MLFLSRGGNYLQLPWVLNIPDAQSAEGGNFYVYLQLPHFKVSVVYRLVGLVVNASALIAEDPGFESRLRRNLSGPSHTSDFKTGTAVAALPGA